MDTYNVFPHGARTRSELAALDVRSRMFRVGMSVEQARRMPAAPHVRPLGAWVDWYGSWPYTSYGILWLPTHGQHLSGSTAKRR